MGERANGLRGISRQNASGLPMTKGADPLASASNLFSSPRPAVLYCQNGGNSTRLVNITPPLKSSKLTAHRKRRRRPSGSVPNAWRGLSPSVRGLSPWANGRLTPSAQDNLSFVRIASPGSIASAGSVPIGRARVLTRRAWGLSPTISPGVCPHGGLVGSAFYRRLKKTIWQ